MVQDVYKDDAVERIVWMGDHHAVELADGDLRVWPDQHVDPLDGEIPALRFEQRVECAVAAPDIQHLGVLGQETLDVSGQHLDPATCAVGLVEPLGQAHRRLIPRMLTKKPESIV